MGHGHHPDSGCNKLKPATAVGKGETALIAALSEKFGPPPPGVILGIGDDCAALRLNRAEYLLWTVDTLMEGVHFDLAYTSLAQLGWKALAVNLSDIAAMGGIPGFALLALGWPPERDLDLALEFADGLAEAAREYGVVVVGGDTVSSPGRLAITLTLTGVVPVSQMVRRSGAKVGDRIYVTGVLGEAAAGLVLLQGRLTEVDPGLAAALKEAHLAPRPQLSAGRVLAREGLATAMIDLSDGVATDLFHVCRASGVGARLSSGAVPVAPRVTAAAPVLKRDPLNLALTGGEDYQLLFTSPPQAADRLWQTFAQAGLAPPLLLGEIVAGERVLLDTPTGMVDISGRGFDHFRLDLEREEI